MSKAKTGVLYVRQQMDGAGNYFYIVDKVQDTLAVKVGDRLKPGELQAKLASVNPTYRVVIT